MQQSLASIGPAVHLIVEKFLNYWFIFSLIKKFSVGLIQKIWCIILLKIPFWLFQYLFLCNMEMMSWEIKIALMQIYVLKISNCSFFSSWCLFVRLNKFNCTKMMRKNFKFHNQQLVGNVVRSLNTNIIIILIFAVDSKSTYQDVKCVKAIGQAILLW